MKILVLDARGGALGDEICIEPVVRYACSMNLYDVRVLSGYPEVFKHLNIPVGLTQDNILVNNEQHIYVPACPRMMCNGVFSEHPFAHFAQPLLCHPVDFVSLFMLRRMLPDEAKRPELVYSEEAQKRVQEICPDLDVAFHIGATEKCRAFPQDYAQAIVDRLETDGLRIAIFGKSTQHMPNIRCKIDLVDKLDLEMLFAFIRCFAPITLTNDSAPVHIGGAFDNHLVVIPTIRHPDRLLHMRYGSRYYKANVLYKRLMYDDISLPLDSLVGDKRWADVENRREEFLPEIDSVVSCVGYINTSK